MRLIISFYLFLLIGLVVYSYGFIDQNFPVKGPQFIFDLIHFQRPISTSLYAVIISLFFIFYGLFLKLIAKKALKAKGVWKIILLTSVILFPAFPAFSYDIFNYILTAKVTFFYLENPYIVMPIEISNEPMLAFTHAANKIALYGPFWLVLTFVPHIIGFGNILATIYAFKLLMIGFYLGLSWLIWQLSGKNLFVVALFSLNPLVLIETQVSAHNDIVMMFFALLTFYLLQREKILFSFTSLILSILIKYATIFLLPIYFFTLYKIIIKRKIEWEAVWRLAGLSMFAIFLLSPLREEMYPWYFIWVLTFVVLIPKALFIQTISLAFSAGLSFRVLPYLYTGTWEGITPLVKKIVTFLPPVLAILLYAIKKKF